jgi:hypothetical protein
MAYTCPIETEATFEDRADATQAKNFISLSDIGFCLTASVSNEERL